MNLSTILAIALALSVAAGAVAFNRYQAATERADKAEATLATHSANDKVVTKYVEKIVTVEKRVPVAANNLERLCRDWSLRSPGNPDAAPQRDASIGQIAGLASDLARARQNAEQLSALQESLRPQVAK